MERFREKSVANGVATKSHHLFSCGGHRPRPMDPEILYHTSVSLSRRKLRKMQKKVHNPEMRALCKITIKIIKKILDKWLRRCYNKDTKREGNLLKKKRRLDYV